MVDDKMFMSVFYVHKSLSDNEACIFISIFLIYQYVYVFKSETVFLWVFSDCTVKMLSKIANDAKVIEVNVLLNKRQIF